MKRGTYYKLREENKGPKERLALYENGFSDVAVEENVIKAITYFEETFHRTKRELKNAWEKNEEECDNMGTPCYDGPNEYALISIFDNLFNFSQPVSVKFVFGKETGEYNMMPAQWDWLKGLGDGDPSKELDKLVQMYVVCSTK